MGGRKLSPTTVLIVGYLFSALFLITSLYLAVYLVFRVPVSGINEIEWLGIRVKTDVAGLMCFIFGSLISFQSVRSTLACARSLSADGTVSGRRSDRPKYTTIFRSTAKKLDIIAGDLNTAFNEGSAELSNMKGQAETYLLVVLDEIISLSRVASTLASEFQRENEPEKYVQKNDDRLTLRLALFEHAAEFQWLQQALAKHGDILEDKRDVIIHTKESFERLRLNFRQLTQELLEG